MSAAHLLARTKSGDNVSVLADQDGHLLARPALNLHHVVGALDASAAMTPWEITPEGGAGHGYVQLTVLKIGAASAGEALSAEVRYTLAGGGVAVCGA